MRRAGFERGVTLVELLIGMLIGLFLLGATGSVYLASKNSYRTADVASRLQENGRMALRVIAEDIQLAGFMGNAVARGKIARRAGSAGQLIGANGDCASRWYINLGQTLAIGNDTNIYSGSCVGPARNYLASTDIIAVKRASMIEIDHDSPANADWTLLRTDLSRGEFFLGGEAEPDDFDTTTDGVTTDRRWLNHVYFIENPGGNDVPRLRRLYLHGGPTLSLDDFEIRGVQDLQIQLGIDTDGDGAANSFVEPGTEGSDPVLAARIWVLMQSETPEADLDDTAGYLYAARSYVPGDGSAIEVTPNPERYRRLLLSTTVTLRN